MSHFEAYLKSFLQEVYSTKFTMAISFKYFDQKKQNVDFNVKAFRQVLFGMNPDVISIQICVLASDFELK